jgi:hypothetical protein
LNESTKQWELVSDIPQMSNPMALNGATYVTQPAPPTPAPLPANEDVIEEETEGVLRTNIDLRNNINVRNPIPSRIFTDLAEEQNYQEQMVDVAFAFQNGIAASFPDVVKGLNVSGFGIYNCDQIYRVKNRVQITVSSQDSEGTPINDLHSLSLIDLNLNGAFSFNPK